MQKYSALISVYNKEKANFLKKAIDSIFSQTVRPSQIVLVEDGELNQELEDTIHKFEIFSRNERIEFKVIRNKVNKGLGPCLNQGMDFCHEKLIARFDSDDISKNYRMEKILKYFEKHKHVSAVGGCIAEFKDDGNKISGYRRVPVGYSNIVKYSKKRNPMNHVTVVFKADDVKAVGGYENVPGFEDYYLWLKLITNNYILANLMDVLVLVRVGNNFESRRRGLSYIKKEVSFEWIIYRENMISFSRFLMNVCIRTTVRLLPPNVLGSIYKILRNNKI